jgi:ATP-dependent RNA helicase DBP3
LLQITSGFKNPTAIQSQCWPFLLSGKDVIGIAETGSGKTLAFAIPAFVHLRNIEVKKNEGPYVLIVAPTRELAIQIFEVCDELGKSTNIKCACFYGGVSKQGQYESLEKGVHVLVATPGRLLDLMQEQAVSLDKVSIAVLDEADRMLDKGFERDIKTILSSTRPDRQTIMFSATWPTSIRNLAATFLKNPTRVTIGTAELSANQKITQYVEVIETEREKDQKLLELLRDYHKSKKNRILIFVLYKREAPKIEGLLKRQNYKVASIHGDMSQVQRIASLASFKDGTCPLLVATDVAARGLDIPDVEYVINYSFPLTIEDYVHRIGRTGRAGKTGISFTMFTSQDKLRAAELVGILREANSDIPPALMKLSSYGTKKQEHALYGAHAKDLGNKPMPKKLHVKFDD